LQPYPDVLGSSVFLVMRRLRQPGSDVQFGLRGSELDDRRSRRLLPGPRAGRKLGTAAIRRISGATSGCDFLNTRPPYFPECPDRCASGRRGRIPMPPLRSAAREINFS
jgi:hypothetical protein